MPPPQGCNLEIVLRVSQAPVSFQSLNLGHLMPVKSCLSIAESHMTAGSCPHPQLHLQDAASWCLSSAALLGSSLRPSSRPTFHHSQVASLLACCAWSSTPLLAPVLALVP